MSTPAQGGVWSFAPQPAKIGANGTFTIASYDWYQTRAPRISMGTIQGQQIFPPEVGGTIVPTGAFKDSHFFGGTVDLYPRLEETLGWLLYAGMGAVSSVTGVNKDGTVTSGVNTHLFRFDPNSSYNLPWLAARCKLPGSQASDNLGEVGFDCKVASLAFTIPNMGKIAARIAMVGRDSFFDEDVNTWTYENAMEDSESTAESGRGSVTWGGETFPVVGLTIEMSNNLTTPQQEIVVGDFRPDDFVPLTRAMTIRMTYKVNDYNLYQQLLTGSASGEVWDSLPFFKETAGAVRAMEAHFQAPQVIPGTSTRYGLTFRANKVVLQNDGYPELRGGDLVYFNINATVLDPDPGLDYATIIVENAQTAYSWS